MDDDDLMLPNRLEEHLAAVGDGVSGSYGGWVDIDASIVALGNADNLSFNSCRFERFKEAIHPSMRTSMIRFQMCFNEQQPSAQCV